MLIADIKEVNQLNDIIFLNERKQNMLTEAIKQCYPTDIIYLTDKEDKFLQDLWEPDDRKNIKIPSDIFFAGTVPLLDCEVFVADEIAETRARVIIFEDYKEQIDNAPLNVATVVGVFIPYTPFDGEVFIPLCVAKGQNYLGTAGVGTFSEEAKNVLKFSSIKQQDMHQLSIAFLETWYGIQISLLHPNIKTVYSNPSNVVYSKSENHKKTSKKRKIKYVKKHILKLENIEQTVQSDNHKINRKCLAWYVVGHWRTYKNGKVVFVKPYWKGALRKLKSLSGEENRIREINC